MPDTVELRGLRLLARLGVLPEERERAQPVEIDLDLVVDLQDAARSDALADTVDYGALCDRVAEVVAAGHVDLLERLAQVVAQAALACDDRVEAVTVAVRKLRPPVPHPLDSAGVRVTRAR